MGRIGLDGSNTAVRRRLGEVDVEAEVEGRDGGTPRWLATLDVDV